MSFRKLLDRSISVIPRTVSGLDSRNDEILEDGTPIEGVPAARDLAGTEEQGGDRDAVSRRWLYMLPAVLDDGSALELDAYAVIEDGGVRFEILGEPELLRSGRRTRPHHWELTVERKS